MERATTTASTLLRLEGADALPLLHRISTQSLAELGPGEARATLFCDFRARLLHRAIVVLTRDGGVWLLHPDAPGSDLAAFVDAHVFREDVAVEVCQAPRVVRIAAAAANAPIHNTEREGVPHIVSLDHGEVLCVGEPAAGEALGEPERIAAGLPRHGHEISEDFNPFEVGLAHEVHLAKGCFTGQETLMRLVTYRSVRRRLAHVTGRGAPSETPRPLTLAGAPCGVLTSAAAGEETWTGLAVLKDEALGPGARVECGSGRLESVTAFPITRPLGLP